MHKVLDLSTASIPSGTPPQRKLLMIDSGPYAGRLFCLYNESPATIAFTWADPPYTIWASPYNQITDSADYPPSACIDSQGNIYIVYVQQTSLNLIFFKMPFVAGMWQSGMPHTVLSEGLGYYPVISRDIDGGLWCGFAYYDTANEYFEARAKYSSNDGVLWGAGPSDPGYLLSNSSTVMPYISINCPGSDAVAVYCESRSSLYLRKFVTVWQTPIQVYLGDYIDSNFDCALSNDLKLGIAFTPSTENRVYYREYDGVTLGGLQEAHSGDSRSPQIAYHNNKPYIYFAENIGNSRNLPGCAIRQSSGFESVNLIDGMGLLDSFLIFESTSSIYEDKTDVAASESAGDIFHSASNTMLSSSGDIAFFGRDSKFYSLSVTLSITATGGSIIWEYYDGQNWVAFTPYSGDSDLDQVDTVIYLWNDMANVPDSWQMSKVNSIYKYWIRARVENALSVAPVGSQITAVPKCDYLSLIRRSA